MADVFTHGQSYPMKPRPGSKFMKRDTEKVIERVVTDAVGDMPYVFEESQQLTKDLCVRVQDSVNEMGYERYKLVVQVTITEAAQQGLRVASRCLWDPEVDNYAEYTHSTQHMHANVVVFAFYME